MTKKPGTKQSHGEKAVKDIRCATRKQYSAEEKIRIVLDILKGEDMLGASMVATSKILEWSTPSIGTSMSAPATKD